MSEQTKRLQRALQAWIDCPMPTDPMIVCRHIQIGAESERALAHSRCADALERIAEAAPPEGQMFAFCGHGVAFCQWCLAERGAFKP